MQKFVEYIEANGVKVDEIKEDAIFANGFTVIREALEKNEWSDILDCLLDKRQPRHLTHVTRITGYYSSIHNWGRSKIGELRARRRGNYSFPGCKMDASGRGAFGR